MNGKNIRDSIYGDIHFSGAELKVMDTQALQRLRGIKQLGTSYLVYPGAVHTRFEHSLGTSHMAKLIMESVERNSSFRFNPLDKKAISLAALIHDVTHMPFGHTLEDERRIFPRHDRDADRLDYFVSKGEIGAILREEKILNRVVKLLKSRALKPGEDAFSRQIISHTICADLLDYLRRDAKFCGLKLNYDDRIFRYFQIEDGRLILNLQKSGLFRHDAFSEVIQILRFRYFLTERIYYHHAKIASGAMLSRAVEIAVSNGFKTERLYQLSDDALLYILQNEFKSNQAIQRLVGKYLKRDLYKRVYVLTDLNLNPDERRKISKKYHINEKGERAVTEKRIAKTVKIPGEAVILYAPPPSMNFKEANVLVKVDDAPAQPLCNWQNREVQSLQAKYGTLWKFYVFVDSEYSQRFPIISDACGKFVGMPNELPLIQKGQLSLFPI